jgi:hypothetical protein
MATPERNIAGYWWGGRFHPIRSGVIWPKAQPGKRRPDPRQSELDYNEFKTNDLTRSRRMTEVDQTLTQAVRSAGGIKPDRSGANEGEWRRLTYKESGVRGLAFPGASHTAEDMAHHMRELGYNVPSDPNEFLWVLEADAAGQKIVHHPEWYEREAERLYYERNPRQSNSFNQIFVVASQSPNWPWKLTDQNGNTLGKKHESGRGIVPFRFKTPEAAIRKVKQLMSRSGATPPHQNSAPSAIFTEQDERTARRATLHDFRTGSQVRIKGTKKTAVIDSPLRDRTRGVVGYKLRGGGLVLAEEVEFLNPPRATREQQRYAAELAGAWGRRELTTAHRARIETAGRAVGLNLRQIRSQVKRAQAQQNGFLVSSISKFQAGREVKKSYRKELGIKNDIKQAAREEQEANKKAEAATNLVSQRYWERKAASAYKRRVKLEAQLAKAKQRTQTAAQKAMGAYSNPGRSAADVSPAMAATMLRANVGNRPVDPAKIDGMAAMMKRGIYTRRKPITFVNDVLTDGQHTLLAIIKSGVTVPLTVEHKTLSPGARRHAPNAPTKKGVGASEANPLGEVGLQAVGGFAAGVAGAATGAMLAPLIEKFVKGKKEKRAALAAVAQNPGRLDPATARTLASLGRSRLLLAARELGQAKQPGKTKEQQQAHRQRATAYQQQALAFINRAALAFPIHGNPIRATPAAVERFHREFRGFPTTGQVTRYAVPPGTPPDTPYLGQLYKIFLKGGQVLTFENNPAALLGTVTGRRRLLIGLSHPYKTPNGIDHRRLLNYGEVIEVQYITPKPHLYDTADEKLFFHELGEEGGKCPELVLQNGRLSFRGGSYTIKREGIRN